jgi:hypothetical protein
MGYCHDIISSSNQILRFTTKFKESRVSWTQTDSCTCNAITFYSTSVYHMQGLLFLSFFRATYWGRVLHGIRISMR